jgi:hypothetical protein
VSRRTLNGMITPNPRCFGVWGVIGKRVEVENPNGVSAKCAICPGLGLRYRLTNSIELELKSQCATCRVSCVVRVRGAGAALVSCLLFI